MRQIPQVTVITTKEAYLIASRPFVIDVIQELFNLDKIRKVISKCHTKDEYLLAIQMLWRYELRHPDNVEICSLLSRIKVFAEWKKRECILNDRRKRIEIENGQINLN